MAFEPFEHDDLQRPHGGQQRVGAELARNAKVPLPAGDCHACERVHHVSVGVVAQADIEDDIQAVNRVAGVPQALHPGGIAVVYLVEGGGQLMPDQVVLSGQHAVCPVSRCEDILCIKVRYFTILASDPSADPSPAPDTGDTHAVDCRPP